VPFNKFSKTNCPKSEIPKVNMGGARCHLGHEDWVIGHKKRIIDTSNETSTHVHRFMKLYNYTNLHIYMYIYIYVIYIHVYIHVYM
jgi:hypothetical protein